MSRLVALGALLVAIILIACTTHILTFRHKAGLSHNAAATSSFSRGKNLKVLPHALMQEESQESEEARERGPKHIERDYQRATPSYTNLEGPRALEYEKAETRTDSSGGLMLEGAAIGRREFARLTGFHDSDSDSERGSSSAGPVKAIYPSATSRTNAPYVASGRISALAIDPRCGISQAAKSDDSEDSRCRLYVGAAGGGIWRTDPSVYVPQRRQLPSYRVLIHHIGGVCFY